MAVYFAARAVSGAELDFLSLDKFGQMIADSASGKLSTTQILVYYPSVTILFYKTASTRKNIQ